ncbi:molybdopterin-dependent oxidoreductase [Acanthopleuribacter pedis]|uniref:Molybdopterin-dependent oxidoreductase n=1 Tax=Acanthopleuribacter pedis TaxID=442870 RepID=A0A8J7U4N5_9BACT|nr:molybdopterin-dependent oxidoreductase [Acanthopleuribacter pedis]MBO1318486.1 molybdopterin-dependent oxidoreductase [Acanthopleuribacter pedis]
MAKQTRVLRVVGDNGEGHKRNPLPSPADWRLRLKADGFARDFSLADLAALETADLEMGILCVSAGRIAGNNTSVRFTGLPFTRLVAEIGDVSAYQTVIFRSKARATCGPKHLAHETSLDMDYCLNSGQVMLAWKLNGEDLPYDNGFPLRSTVGPDRFFYKSLKWLGEIELTTRPIDVCRGTWETYAGYHNLARVAEDERFTPIMRLITQVAPDGSDISDEITEAHWQATLDDLVAKGDFSRLILAKVDVMQQKMGLSLPKDFQGFKFRDGKFVAKLRGCKFSKTSFVGTDMQGVNLSLTRLNHCLLNGADLTKVDAEGADFSSADLTGANMREAYLAGAKFYSDKNLAKDTKPEKGAKVQGLDLTGAKDIDEKQAEWLRLDGALL